MKKLIAILLLASMSFTFTSCDSWLDVNNNVDAPDYIQEDLYLAGILAELGMATALDIRATGPLTQSLSTTGYTNYANHFYSKASDAAASMWRCVYWIHGMNLENMINQSLENESYRLAGIGYAIKAYGWDQLTKLHGELPMKQAFEPGRLSHDYDYQDDVYTQVREWANTAIEYLQMEDKTDYGNRLKDADLMYAGDADKWIKFAHGVIVRNLSSLTNKNDFSSAYAQDLITHAGLALAANSDNAVMHSLGGGTDAQFSNYNSEWGVWWDTFDGYFAHDFAVQVMTGTLPLYDSVSGDKLQADPDPETGEISEIFPYALAPKQYVTDTSDVKGHFDPRVTAKIGTMDARFYNNMNNIDSIKSWVYYGGSFTSASGPIATAPNLWGTREGQASSGSIDGQGRWLYKNDGDYILMTAAEIQFCLAEAYWKLGQKGNALAAFKKAVALDVDFTGSMLAPGAPKETGKDEDGNVIYAVGGNLPGGDVITKDAYAQLASEYIAGPYVEGMTEDEFELSHIMLQKFVSLFPWGSTETWVDMRKYHYDIKYTGDVPSLNNGWTLSTIDQKWDSDETKVYKGLYLKPAQVENRRSAYHEENHGSPCYRIRPRYNSEYMWNKPALDALKPIGGREENYQCSIPWFAYPGDMPR
ncbi:MAG: SusD/RagB family nutrient-binding outer membrane lipoprotein [Bacteroidales bacterium]|nr:SusD/RagB family nutrient-binding outer membrane lipoprotein [Bacteroidales bacterium]